MKRGKRSTPRVVAKQITITLLAAGLAGCALDNTEFRSKSTTHQGGTTQWQTLFAEGKDDLRADRLGLAIDKLQAALAKQPGSVEIVNAVGVAYDRIGRHELAQIYFERALAMAPDSLQTLNNLGYSLSLQGRHEEAVDYLQRAALRPGNPSVDKVVTRNYRIAMNKLRVASARNKPPISQQASLAGKINCPANAIWIERTAARVHTLVTKPSPGARAALAKLSDAGPNGASKRSCLATLRDTLKVLPPISESVQPMRVTAIRMGVAIPVAAPRIPVEKASTGINRAAAGYAPTIEVSNGVGRGKLAARMRGYFQSTGQRIGRLTNASRFNHDKTVIFYRKGHAETAKRLADLLPIPVRISPTEKQAIDVRVRLGNDVLEFDKNILMKEHKV